LLSSTGDGIQEGEKFMMKSMSWGKKGIEFLKSENKQRVLGLKKIPGRNFILRF